MVGGRVQLVMSVALKHRARARYRSVEVYELPWLTTMIRKLEKEQQAGHDAAQGAFMPRI